MKNYLVLLSFLFSFLVWAGDVVDFNDIIENGSPYYREVTLYQLSRGPILPGNIKSDVLHLVFHQNLESIEKTLSNLRMNLADAEKDGEDLSESMGKIFKFLRYYIENSERGDIYKEKEIQLLGRLTLLFYDCLTPEIVNENIIFLLQWMNRHKATGNGNFDHIAKDRSLGMQRRSLEAIAEMLIGLDIYYNRIANADAKAYRQVQKDKLVRLVKNTYNNLNELYSGPGELKLRQSFLFVLILNSNLDQMNEFSRQLFEGFNANNIPTNTNNPEQAAQEKVAKMACLLKISSLVQTYAWLAKLTATTRDPHSRDGIAFHIRSLPVMRSLFGLDTYTKNGPLVFLRERTMKMFESLQQKLRFNEDFINVNSELNQKKSVHSSQGRPYTSEDTNEIQLKIEAEINSLERLVRSSPDIQLYLDDRGPVNIGRISINPAPAPRETKSWTRKFMPQWFSNYLDRPPHR